MEVPGYPAFAWTAVACIWPDEARQKTTIGRRFSVLVGPLVQICTRIHNKKEKYIWNNNSYGT
jgi:hypothetical protein